MCGRFTLRTSPQRLLDDFGASFPEFTPRYNIAPTQLVFALRAGPDGTGREAAAFRWGLVPSWAKDIKLAAKSINARGETVAEKPMFRAAMKRRRCLVIADDLREEPIDEFLQEARELQRNLPIFVITDPDDVAEAVSAMRHGATAVIEIPPSYAALCDEVSRAVQ